MFHIHETTGYGILYLPENNGNQIATLKRIKGISEVEISWTNSLKPVTDTINMLWQEKKTKNQRYYPALPT